MFTNFFKFRRRYLFLVAGLFFAVLSTAIWYGIESDLAAHSPEAVQRYYLYYLFISTSLFLGGLGYYIGSSQDMLYRFLELDPLTKLLNQQSFFRKTQEFINLGQRYQDSVSIIMIDIDYFKLVNDNHSHMVGSFVLKNIGQMIAANLRKSDLAARFGGDEFIICLPRTDVKKAVNVAERLREAIGEAEFCYKNHKVKVTASMGIASGLCSQKLRAEDLAEQADHLLYSAKDEGRNRICTASVEETVEPEDLLLDRRNRKAM